MADASDSPSDDPEVGLARLREIMRRLRDPERGCPWDLEQDFRSIAPYTVEEAYEVADAIERAAWDELPGELGDLLLQVVYHAQMAEEEGLFTLEDVTDTICRKMIRRHPHVFGSERGGRTAEEQKVHWEAVKAAERVAAERSGAAADAEPGRASALDGVPAALPGLTRAAKLQARAARVGFDWPSSREVLAKIVEEARELEAETDPDRVEDEFGDLLFAIVNLGRHLKVDPEAAMRRVNRKFERRFRAVEAALAAAGRGAEDATLAEMDALWNEAKAAERR